ncbi:MobC family plasmid mobilization relaxosome protein [Ruthenibacterium lactatiformans]|uniref:MobC family plasmid mobilization relaxosome protein n=1 Tax=Ruthenibacterium lactatiformans TaxID=1550024 RepID=A0A6I2U8W9_9FIRM|nr:plasmid mobilization relaxosome protein MobC [Ruthenibacterium lactatiformans]MST91365.1 MobC family plasmid mobilization relaxosome protein [Ruthenibacterium lactatiformans]
MKKRIRNRQIIFWVSPVEEAMIEERMSQVGTKSLSAYLRKIAIDGMIINLQIPELKEIISLLRRCSNSLNQIAKRVNSTGRIYDAEMEQILQNQEELWRAVNELLRKLSAIK